MSNLRQRLPPVTALVAFEAAARLGNFTRAATELNLTQAAISRQIRQMERSIGTRLFERRRYDVTLTEHGRQLAAAVGGSLHAIAEVTDAIRRADVSGDEVVVYCEMALAARRLIPRLDDFSRRHPAVQLKIMTSSQPLELVGETIDVGLQFGARDPVRFEAIDIAGDTVIPVSSPAFAGQFADGFSARKLAEMRLLHLEQTGSAWLDWPRFLAAHDVSAGRKPGDLVFDTYSSLIEAAISGSGVALGWGLAVEHCLKEGTLIRLGDLVLPAPERLYAHVPKHRKRSKATNQFIDWLVQDFTK